MLRYAAIVNHEFNAVDTMVFYGIFYWGRAVFNERIGAQILLSAGLMKTGAKEMLGGRVNVGAVELSTGTVLAILSIYEGILLEKDHHSEHF